MFPIPQEDEKFEDYEISCKVLALHPELSSFFEAEVRGREGDTVDLHFHDESEDLVVNVQRRFVLDLKIRAM